MWIKKNLVHQFGDQTKAGTHCTGGCVGPQGRSGQVRKISPPTGIRSPVLSARSQSLYQLRYAALQDSISHEIRYSYPWGFLWNSEKPITKAVTKTAHNKHKALRAVPAIALECTATAITISKYFFWHLYVLGGLYYERPWVLAHRTDRLWRHDTVRCFSIC
jgi:hypothetical protein